MLKYLLLSRCDLHTLNTIADELRESFHNFDRAAQDLEHKKDSDLAATRRYRRMATEAATAHREVWNAIGRIRLHNL